MQLNPKIKAYTRVEAATAVHGLLEVAKAANVDMIKDFTNELESLYKFFAPQVPTTGLNMFDYMARFVANESDIRTHLRYICVRQGVAYATNGHVAVWGDCDLADGMYHPTLINGVDVSTSDYPDFGKMTPTDSMLENEQTVHIKDLEVQTVSMGGKGGRFVKLGKHTFDFNTLLEVANGSESFGIRLPRVTSFPAIAYMQGNFDFEPTRILVMPTLPVTEVSA